MGRTKRKRTKNKLQLSNVNLGHERTVINLKKWLKANNFVDPLNLELRNFIGTGRGVTARKGIQPSDVLIRVPFGLLITFDTVRKSDLLCYLTQEIPLTIQTFLALFLIMEKHKGVKSKWKNYIDSLPYPEPTLPWMCEPEDINLYPEDLKLEALKLQEIFNDCIENVKRSLLTTEVCKCCGEPVNYLVESCSLKWAYVLVNTRAVYIDPEYLMSNDNSNASWLADDPFLALCPYMDLINHHYVAKTKANVVSIQGQAFYQLTTMTAFKKYEQFFISYGAHNNDKLLMQYGFFIPGNFFDSIRISLEEILTVLNVPLTERQYKYIKSHKYEADDLYINENGVSFILKAILFVCFHPNILNYGAYIFSNRYPNSFDDLVTKSSKSLLRFKLEIYENDLKRPSENGKFSNACFQTLKEYLEYRIKYIRELLRLLDENKLHFS
ncbi:hypothetical protein ABEB36_002832 [Hypothenemus hampei]|uniref:SET domain-containing protein n=1 Tax=Hypothenemus hampei TaxID=57062 RepID=A0ABD1F741_HYPHA